MVYAPMLKIYNGGADTQVEVERLSFYNLTATEKSATICAKK